MHESQRKNEYRIEREMLDAELASIRESRRNTIFGMKLFASASGVSLVFLTGLLWLREFVWTWLAYGLAFVAAIFALSCMLCLYLLIREALAWHYWREKECKRIETVHKQADKDFG